MYKTRDYDVQITQKGKSHPTFKWILNACGADNAESFAVDILSGMSHRETYGANDDSPIGYKMASRMFIVKVRVNRG